MAMYSFVHPFHEVTFCGVPPFVRDTGAQGQKGCGTLVYAYAFN
jgi:hypothetical protein